MTNRAKIAERTAYLSTDFGEQMASRYFPAEALERLGRYVRGKRKGKLKGQITWRKVERGGWVSTYGGTGNSDYAGYVETRVGKVIEARLETTPWGDSPETIDLWISPRI